MQIIKLFLAIFNFILFLITNRKRLKHVLFMMYITIKRLVRIIEQHNIRISFEPNEKYIIASLYEETDNAGNFFNLITPETILTKWKNVLSKKKWAHPHKKPGRPPITKTIKELILKFKKDNFSWGSRHIRDELKKLFITVSHETINKTINYFIKTGDIKPTLSWTRFISSHLETLFSCDFLTIDIFGFKRYYVFFIIKLETRKIVQFAVTDHPNIQFLRNQFSVFGYEYPGSTLIHDNSSELKWFPYKEYNIKDVAIVPYSPNMNAYAERFVRSIRQECLDYFIIFTYGQLRNIVRSYIDYYNNYRPHQGLKDIPNGLPAECSKTGEIKQKSLLFGLHNHYYREAA